MDINGRVMAHMHRAAATLDAAPQGNVTHGEVGFRVWSVGGEVKAVLFECESLHYEM